MTMQEENDDEDEENEGDDVDEVDDEDEFLKNDHELCPFTGLTIREKKIIKDSWAAIEEKGSSDDHDVSLFYWLLEFIPHYKTRISQKFPKSLPLHPFLVEEYLVTHAEAVMLSFECFVYLLHDPEKLEDKMRSLARHHVRLRPCVGVEFFKHFDEHFAVLIFNCLFVDDVDVDDEQVLVWMKLIHVFCRVVREEEETMRQKRLFPCCPIM